MIEQNDFDLRHVGQGQDRVEYQPNLPRELAITEAAVLAGATPL
jgi:hypothetical protein